MKPNVASRLGTDTPLPRDLITGIKKGEIKIPKFQRQFIWNEEQALNLLDSIASNYPVGSLLFWKTVNKLAAERNIGDFQLPETDDLTPTDYVLDGQQRLTVIYSCLGAPESDPGFQAAYDLENETFIRKPDRHQSHIFPLRILFDTTKLLNFRAGLVSHPMGEQLQQRLDQLIDIFTNYRIPVVILKDLTVEEVCPIFERINSSGTRLSTYDLMVAATWSKEFDLNDEADIIADSLRPKSFGDIEGDTVLKCLAAVHFRGIKRDQVLSLRNLKRNTMDELVVTAKEALLKTVDLLTTEFKVYSWDFLPYEAFAIILTYIFAKRKGLNQQNIERTRQWFWQSAFSERYRGASEHFVSKDLEAIDEFIINGGLPDASFGSIISVETLPKVVFRSNNSRSRAFILMLALNAPRNLTNGALIDTADALSIFNKKEFHHIYPKAFLFREDSIENVNSLVNICMLAASENKRISDQSPFEYLPKLIYEHGQQASNIFKSNLLPSPEEVDYSKLTFEEFLQKRAYILHERINKLCTGDAST
ncbi:MAG TPA: DUF262 domain-containing protein [Syntrophales bacterium]|nr:DUF262 domain-containing protein [Syntrophales bacterium]